jgi:hypothetical protein
MCVNMKLVKTYNRLLFYYTKLTHMEEYEQYVYPRCVMNYLKYPLH